MFKELWWYLLSMISRVCHPHWMLLMNKQKKEKEEDEIKLERIKQNKPSSYSNQRSSSHSVHTHKHTYLRWIPLCKRVLYSMEVVSRWLLKLLFGCLCPYSSYDILWFVTALHSKHTIEVTSANEINQTQQTNKRKTKKKRSLIPIGQRTRYVDSCSTFYFSSIVLVLFFFFFLFMFICCLCCDGS